MRRPGSLTALSALAAAALTGACHLGPEFHPPQVRAPEKWATEVPGALPSWPSSEWWKAFNDPELNRLLEQARRDSPDVAAAVYRVRQAVAQAEIAGAPLLPSVQLTAQSGPERRLNLNGQERNHVLYQGLLGVQYELDFWGGNRAALESAQASANAARFAQEVVWITTTTGIANLYFQTLALEEQVRTVRENLLHARQTLDDISFAEHQGTVPRLAVIQELTMVAGIEALVPPLQQQLAASRNALAILVGSLPEDLHLTVRPLRALARPPVTVGVPSELLGRRPDVKEAEANLVAANADIRVARAQLFPSVTLPLSGGVQSMTVPHLGTVPPIAAYSLLGSVTQPIFQGGALKGRVNQTQARYQELLVGTYRQSVLSAFSEVETALAGLHAAEAEEAAQQRAAAAAQESAGMAVASLLGGTGTTLDVLQSQSAVLGAQDAVVQSRLAYNQSLLSLIKALGGGWQL